jgi:glycine/D-amino acid oxidase-like deaminating enzyme
VFSFWEQNTWFEHVEFCIVGSGIVGLSAAIHLRRKHPNAKILVLERGVLPDGASTKNAGFACFGSLSEIAADLKIMSEDQVVQLIENRWKGLALLRKNLGDNNIGFLNLGGFEIFRPSDSAQFNASLEILETMNDALKTIIPGAPVYSRVDNQINSKGFQGVSGMILNRAESQIDTGKMMLNLIKKAQQLDIQLLHGIQVDGFEEHSKTVQLNTSVGKISTRKLLLTTNGFAQQLLPDLDVKPGRAQVLVTSPIPSLKFEGTYHLDEGYFYFRNFGNRVLLGGGRNLDIQGETTYSHQTTDFIQAHLEQLLKTIILPETEYKIEYRWAGTLGLGISKQPIIEAISDQVFCGVRMGGMGVAIGSKAGEDLAELASNSN